MPSYYFIFYNNSWAFLSNKNLLNKLFNRVLSPFPPENNKMKESLIDFFIMINLQ